MVSNQFMRTWKGGIFMASDLIYKSRIKDVIKEKDLLCDGDLPEAVSEEVSKLLDKAAQRAQENGRKTVRPVDL